MKTPREEGQVLPVLLVFFLTLIAGGVMLFRVGVAAALRAEGATAADAASIAGVEALKNQYMSHILAGADGALDIDDASIRAAAAELAERNGARLVSFDRTGLDVLVTVETLGSVGDVGSGAEVEGQRAVVRSRARLDLAYTRALPTFADGRAGFIRSDELDELADAAGLAAVPAESALRRYAGIGGCGGGIDVAHLVREMKVAILKAESLVGPLRLTSGYRSVECQALLGETVTGLVAAPGRSMHNYGLAIDVANHATLSSVAAEAGLCQPYLQDAVHFSLATGPECGGRRGPLGPSGAFGGDLGSFVTADTFLVDVNGG